MWYLSSVRSLPNVRLPLNDDTFSFSIHLPWYFSVSSCHYEMPWLCSNTHHHVFYLESLCPKAAKPVWVMRLHRRCKTSKWATGIIRLHHLSSVVTKHDLGSRLSKINSKNTPLIEHLVVLLCSQFLERLLNTKCISDIILRLQVAAPNMLHVMRIVTLLDMGTHNCLNVTWVEWTCALLCLGIWEMTMIMKSRRQDLPTVNKHKSID